MKNVFKLFLALCLWVLPCVLIAAGNDPVLKTDTLAAVYIDALQLFNFYSGQAAELIKPENKEKLAELEKQFKNFAKAEVKLADFFQNIDEFAKNELFLPDGSVWLAIDASYRPSLAFKAKVKPLEFFEFLEKKFGKVQPEPVKREKDLVEFSIPAPDFKLIFTLRPDGAYLHAEGEQVAAEDSGKWGDLLQNVANKDALLVAEIDLKGIKGLLSRKNATARHGACFTNLRVLAAALEMHAIDNNAEMKTLDQKQLHAAKYLNSELTCPDGGTYSLGDDKEVQCKVHGTVKKPAERISDADTSIPAPLRSFENVRLKIIKTHAELATLVNDKNLLEQWVAIGKQQLLAIKGMAEKQMGQLPEVDRKKGMEMLDSIKIAADGMWLKVSLEGLDEKMIISGVTGIVGVVSAIAIPNFVKARENAKARACSVSRRIIATAVEMYEMDSAKTAKDLDIEVLVKKNYLKSAPVCGEDGKFSLRRDNNGITIDCSVHKAE